MTGLSKLRVVIGAAGLAMAAGPAAADTLAAFASEATGTWTSAEQSVDPGYDWVESEVVQIWPDRDDGLWLYQESAILGANPEAPADGDPKAAPYFQVVIHVRDLGGGALHTATYRIADQEAVRGAWQRPETFDADWLGPVSCMGQQQRVGEGFWHGGTTCPNGYKGAAKVVSMSVRSPGAYVNWDRGLDASGALVLGPAAGGYIFKRKEAAE